MCRTILLGLVLAVVALALLVTLAGQWLGPWGVVGAVALIVIAGPLVIKFLGKSIMKRLFIGLFDSKSRVLRDATAAVHQVTPAAAPAVAVPDLDGDSPQPGSADAESQPDDDLQADREGSDDGNPSDDGNLGDDDGEDDEGPTPAPRRKDARYFQIEATITPQAGRGPMQHWDLDDLTLVPYEFKVERSADAPDDESCHVEEVQVFAEGHYVEPEGSKFVGEQKIKLLVSVAPGPRRLKFRYYFESFGDIRLP